MITALAAAAPAKSCRTGKCLSPSQWNAMKRKNMEQRLSAPVRVTPAMIKINQQIQVLSKTNAGGRNNAAIKSLHAQRNQMVKGMCR